MGGDFAVVARVAPFARRVLAVMAAAGARREPDLARGGLAIDDDFFAALEFDFQHAFDIVEIGVRRLQRFFEAGE